ncbi:DciA family protein, partial [Alkalihalophilus lindianensis]
RAALPVERPRIGASRQIADLMPDIGRAAFRKFGFVQSSIVTRWTEIVGSHYAAITAPESIRFPVGKKAGGTLQLTVM